MNLQTLLLNLSQSCKLKNNNKSRNGTNHVTNPNSFLFSEEITLLNMQMNLQTFLLIYLGQSCELKDNHATARSFDYLHSFVLSGYLIIKYK